MGAKILIVDDEPHVLRAMAYALRRAGYEVVTAQDGEEALSKVHTEHPDLMILDVMMPGMNGLEVCQRLRKQQETASLPIIVLSAGSQVDDKVRGLEAGADSYVTKPVALSEIIARVAALLQRRAQLTDAAVAAKGQTLAVYGAKGGVGTTFVAVNLAVALRQVSNKSVVLVDANLQFGDVGLALNMRPDHTLLDLRPYLGQLDSELIDSVLVSHSSGIQLLLASLDLEANVSMSPQLLGQVLAKLEETFDYVVVDTWTVLDERTQAVLDSADKIVLLTTPQMSSLRNARLFLNPQEASEHGPETLLVTVNRYDDGGGITTQDITQVLQQRIAARLPDDGDLVMYSLNRGVPLVVSHPRSSVARSLFELAGAIAGAGG